MISILSNKDQELRWKGFEKASAVATGLLCQNFKNMEQFYSEKE